jgi:alpha-L-fucosidase
MKKFLILFVYLLVHQSVSAQWKYEPSAENLKNREWFQQAKLGLFIHWGVYSVLGDGESL